MAAADSTATPARPSYAVVGAICVAVGVAVIPMGGLFIAVGGGLAGTAGLVAGGVATAVVWLAGAWGLAEWVADWRRSA